MQQMSNLDNVVLSKLNNKLLNVDANNGIVFGSRLDVSGNFIPIGYRNKRSGHILFSFVYESKSREYYVCRAVYLFSNGYIPFNNIVAHKDGNKSNNTKDNLCLKKINNESYHIKNIGRGRWTLNEERILIDNYFSMNYNELSDLLNRSSRSIRNKIKLLGVVNKASKRRRWLIDDDKKLINLYTRGALSVKAIANMMDRSESSIRLRANRLLNAYRSDVHLRDIKSSKNFYTAIKGANQRGSLWMKCCMCDYDKYIDLHHIDNNRRHNTIDNIATLCPNHHAEITHGRCNNIILYAIWRRIYSDGSYGDLCDNLNYRKF